MSRAAVAAPPSSMAWSGVNVQSRLGTGWEPAVLVVCTVFLLLAGIISVYSASSVMAQGEGLPDYYFVVRQASGAAAGFVLLVIMAFVDYRRLRLLAWPVLLQRHRARLEWRGRRHGGDRIDFGAG